jgi:hypothetical protein
MVVIQDPVLALDFDLAATVRLLEAERRAMGSDEVSDDGLAPLSPLTKEINW